MAGSALPIILPRIQNPELRFTKYANFLIGLSERRARAARLHATPVDATVDPASLCQLSCPYCAVGAKSVQRTKALLQQETHRRLMQGLADKLFIVWYFNTGEPLLNKRFAAIVAENREQEIFSVISTNLSLKLSDERIDELLESGLGMISVSLDGATAETYSQYRVGGDFDLVTRNLARLTRRKRELGLEYPLIEWRFLVFQHNEHELMLAVDLSRELGVDLLEFYPGAAPPRATGDMVQNMTIRMPPEPVIGPALDRARLDASTVMRRLLRRAPAYEPAPPPEALRHRKCDWLYMGTALFPNGSVSPCCVSNDEPDDFGIIGEGDTFADIWNNEQYETARRLFLDDAMPSTTPIASITPIDGHHDTDATTAPDVICARCPNQNAQDYQFRSTLRGILMNAPDWALKILGADPASFFFDVDLALSPIELRPLYDGSLQIPAVFPDTTVRFERLARQRPELEPTIAHLVDCLESITPGERIQRSAA